MKTKYLLSILLVAFTFTACKPSIAKDEKKASQPDSSVASDKKPEKREVKEAPAKADKSKTAPEKTATPEPKPRETTAKPEPKPRETAPKVPEKKIANINVKESLDMIKKNPALVLIDMRTPGEIARGYIKNALKMNFYAGDFQTQLKKLDRNKSYLIYCASGYRSGKALSMMEGLGFRVAYNMLGGFSAWQRAGYPVEK